MAALMRYLKRLKDKYEYRAGQRRLLKLQESFSTPQDPLWLVPPDQQDTSDRTLAYVAEKALAIYTQHNRTRRCKCQGCTDIRGVLVAYYKGWKP